MAMAGLGFVSVVFESEMLLLTLQARSMATYLPASGPREIIVIDNSARGMSAATTERLMAEYGALSGLVRILRPKDIRDLPSTTGWRSQQILKLCVAEHVGPERYVVLDAKNHFVRPVREDFFQAPDGRPRVTAHGYRDHPLRPDLENVLAYMKLDPAQHLDHFSTTITPFVLDRSVVLSMIDGIEARSGKSFESEFVRYDLTEFFLYSAWILAGGQDLDEFYDFQPVPSPNVWPGSADSSGVLAAVSRAEAGPSPLFSVHRTALARLTDDSVLLLAEFWVAIGLFPSVDEARAFVADFRRVFEKERMRRRARELPRRVRALPRRIRRRALRGR